jgi:osmotically-inducible protein OsmY
MPPTVVQTPPAFSETAGGVTVAALLAAVAVRRGQPLGPTSDQEIEDFISDALDLLPGSGDIEVRCDGGRVTLTGQVSHKRLKRDAGEIAWAIPGVNDVQNNVAIVARRRSRPIREADAPVVQGRKQA